MDRAAVRYDRQGDQHYDVISAFIKSVRGSDADAALHYLARMVEAGEDPRFIARRLVILASEDIGLADPTALTTAVAAAQAVQLIGMPEAPAQPGPGHDRAGAGAEVERRDQGDRRRQRRRARREDRPGAQPPARRPLRGVEEARARQGLPVRPRRALRRSPSSSTPRTWSRTPSTTGPPPSGPRPALKERWERIRTAGRGRKRRARCKVGSSAMSPALAVPLARGRGDAGGAAAACCWPWSCAGRRRTERAAGRRAHRRRRPPGRGSTR